MESFRWCCSLTSKSSFALCLPNFQLQVSSLGKHGSSSKRLISWSVRSHCKALARLASTCSVILFLDQCLLALRKLRLTVMQRASLQRLQVKEMLSECTHVILLATPSATHL